MLALFIFEIKCTSPFLVVHLQVQAYIAPLGGGLLLQSSHGFLSLAPLLSLSKEMNTYDVFQQYDELLTTHIRGHSVNNLHFLTYHVMSFMTIIYHN